MLYYAVPRPEKPVRTTMPMIDIPAAPDAVRVMNSMPKSQRKTLQLLISTFVYACTLAGNKDMEELVGTEPVCGLLDIIVHAMSSRKREIVTLATDGIGVTFKFSADDHENEVPFSIVRIDTPPNDRIAVIVVPGIL